MYLAWPAYLIHGTHDTRKIGRRSSSGCIGLYNEHIAELFAKTEVGTMFWSSDPKGNIGHSGKGAAPGCGALFI